MYRTALRILGRIHDAEDCVQSVLLELLSRTSPPGTNHEAALLRWMTAMRALDRLRRRRASREVLNDDPGDNRATNWGAADELSSDEMLAWLRSAVTRLPARQAEVFALRCFAELSYEEIATALTMDQGAVGVLLHEARQRLQAMLPKDWVENRKARTSRVNTR